MERRALMKGTLLRTDEGVVPIEKIVGVVDDDGDIAEGCKDIHTHIMSALYRNATATQGMSWGIMSGKVFVTKHGYSITVSDDCRLSQFKVYGGWSYKEAQDMRVGDYLTVVGSSSLYGTLKMSDNTLRFIAYAWANCSGNLGNNLCVYTNKFNATIYQYLYDSMHIEYIKTVADNGLVEFIFLRDTVKDYLPFIGNIDNLYKLDKQSLVTFLIAFRKATTVFRKEKREVVTIQYDDYCNNTLLDCLHQLFLMIGIPTYKKEKKGMGSLLVSEFYYKSLIEYGFDGFRSSVEYQNPASVPVKEIRTVDNEVIFKTVKSKNLGSIGGRNPNDYLFDKIVSIRDTYDFGFELSLLGGDEFVANGFSIY